MHMIKDENGNLIPHGAHEHEHQEGCGEHTHCGACGHENDCAQKDPKTEAAALLNYMLKHNEHHAAELDQMGKNLEQLGFEDVARQLHEAVSEFQKGNLRLSLAMTLMREHMKEEA